MYCYKSKCRRKIKIKNNTTARDEADHCVMQLGHSCSEEGGGIKNGQNAFNIVQVLNTLSSTRLPSQLCTLLQTPLLQGLVLFRGV